MVSNVISLITVIRACKQLWGSATSISDGIFWRVWVGSHIDILKRNWSISVKIKWKSQSTNRIESKKHNFIGLRFHGVIVNLLSFIEAKRIVKVFFLEKFYTPPHIQVKRWLFLIFWPHDSVRVAENLICQGGICLLKFCLLNKIVAKILDFEGGCW